MSTYNGQNYIAEQVDSILKQDDVDVHIMVRDDGSSDGTVDIISKYDNVRLIEGNNMGCERSFYELLKQKYDADYYAYSDQDDVWMPDKLITAIMRLEPNKTKPMVYGCNLTACDDKMNPIGLVHNFNSDVEYYRENRNRVFFNIQGCTLVWNRAMQEELWKFTPDPTVAHHDSWVNVLANSKIGGGQFIYDATPHILYRIHGKNTSGFSTNKLCKLLNGLNKYLGKQHPRRDLFAKMILDNYSEMIDQNGEEYKNLCIVRDYKKGVRSKIKLCRSSELRTKSLKSKIFSVFCIVLERW